MKRKITWLVFDVDNLAWRAFHSTGHLTHESNPTGVLYGVLREIRACMRQWQTTDCVFCFDKGPTLRSLEFPWYKENRRLKKYTDEEETARNECRQQINHFKDSVVERVGLGNTLCKKGYEADDLIMSVCKNLQRHERAVIVSGDQDLYQCIQKKVIVHHPAQSKTVREDDFFATYGIAPQLWSRVKAIAGCKSDNVPGIGGLVGEKTACDYLANKIDKIPKNKLLHIQHKESQEIIKRNLKVVELPYKDTPTFKLDYDLKVNVDEWDALMHQYGFSTLMEENLSRGRHG